MIQKICRAHRLWVKKFTTNKGRESMILIDIKHIKLPHQPICHASMRQILLQVLRIHFQLWPAEERDLGIGESEIPPPPPSDPDPLLSAPSMPSRCMCSLRAKSTRFFSSFLAPGLLILIFFFFFSAWRTLAHKYTHWQTERSCTCTRTSQKTPHIRASTHVESNQPCCGQRKNCNASTASKNRPTSWFGNGKKGT